MFPGQALPSMSATASAPSSGVDSAVAPGLASAAAISASSVAARATLSVRALRGGSTRFAPWSLIGGGRAEVSGECAEGYYVQPTILQGHNKMRVFQEEIFGPVVAMTSFTDFDDAIALANDTLYGLGAGVWTRDADTAFRAGRAIEAGRVWTNCYHLYPAHAAFGGYKQSGIGRETHVKMLEHYQQTKNLIVSHDEKPMGFF